MNRELRVRNRKLDVELSFMKLLPIIFMILLTLMSVAIGSAGGSSTLPPVAD